MVQVPEPRILLRTLFSLPLTLSVPFSYAEAQFLFTTARTQVW